LPATARRGCAAGQRRHHDGDANEANSFRSFSHCAFDRIRSLWLTLARFSEEVRHCVWEQLIERPGGPMTFRFILRPAWRRIAALRDGVNDAKSRRCPYFWALLANPFERGYEGLISTARVILLGLCMDAIYQWIVLKTFYPGEAVIVAVALAFFPYLLLRGPIAASRAGGLTPRREKVGDGGDRRRGQPNRSGCFARYVQIRRERGQLAWQIRALTQSLAGSKSRRQPQIISPGCARGSALSEP
jgi:hypothetical protein